MAFKKYQKYKPIRPQEEPSEVKLFNISDLPKEEQQQIKAMFYEIELRKSDKKK